MNSEVGELPRRKPTTNIQDIIGYEFRRRGITQKEAYNRYKGCY
jgi:hypothetical protein